MGGNALFFSSLIFILCFLNLLVPSLSLTLLGDAFAHEDGKVSLTSSSSPPPPSSIGVGRALISHPIRFLDPSTNSTASFNSRFSFYVTPFNDSSSSPPSFGDGLTFIITSNPYTVGNAFGYIGLSDQTEDGMYIAIEFDTSFDPSFEDISGNHIGIDINSVISFASVDSTTMGFDLKNGKRTTIWVEYNDSLKMLKVWLSYTKSRTIGQPILSTHIDLTTYLEEFMFIGFSASNGKRGSAKHVVEKWRFSTYGFYPWLDSNVEVEGGCDVCESDKPPETTKNSDLAYKVGGGIFIFLVLMVLCCVSRCLMKRTRRADIEDVALQHCDIELTQVPQRLRFNEIREATRDFAASKLLGEDGLRTVYEGQLASGEKVAVKQFRRIKNVDAGDDPFMNELVRVKHRNLLQLQGWCIDGGQRILVFEYMPDTTLDKLLETTGDSPVTKLKWADRQTIVLGVASALTYLHEKCSSLHRDVNASSIMIDADFTAKLVHFSLTEMYDPDENIPAGKMGYLAPEYVSSRVHTEKTDVYSFGVVILVVATGKRPIKIDGRTFVNWVWSKWLDGNLVEAADPSLMRRFKIKEMEGMLQVGLACVSVNCDDRPTVKEAAKMLKGEARLPVLVLPA